MQSDLFVPSAYCLYGKSKPVDDTIQMLEFTNIDNITCMYCLRVLCLPCDRLAFVSLIVFFLWNRPFGAFLMKNSSTLPISMLDQSTLVI